MSTTTTPARSGHPDARPSSTDDERYAAFDRAPARHVRRVGGHAARPRRRVRGRRAVGQPRRTTATTGTLVQAMEERALFLLLLLRQPRLRMIYVTSLPVREAVVEYYLGLLPGVIPRARPPTADHGLARRRRSRAR